MLLPPWPRLWICDSSAPTTIFGNSRRRSWWSASPIWLETQESPWHSCQGWGAASRRSPVSGFSSWTPGSLDWPGRCTLNPYRLTVSKDEKGEINRSSTWRDRRYDNAWLYVARLALSLCFPRLATTLIIITELETIIRDMVSMAFCPSRHLSDQCPAR